MRLTHEQFRELAAKHGVAVTHQRQVVYEAVIASHGHYSPEDICAAVRRRVPSISVATVYNNLRIFIECGMLREVTPHASTLRVDGNLNLITIWSVPAANRCRTSKESSSISIGYPGNCRAALI